MKCAGYHRDAWRIRYDPGNGKVGLSCTVIFKEYMVRNYLIWMVLLSAATYALNAQVDSSQQAIFNQIYSAAERSFPTCASINEVHALIIP